MKIDILARTPGAILLMNAIGLLPREIYEKIPQAGRENPGDVDVVVTINGVEVPFTEAIEESMKCLYARLDEEVKEKAIDLLKGDETLSHLYCTIESAEWRIRERLDKVLKSEENTHGK